MKPIRRGNLYRTPRALWLVTDVTNTWVHYRVYSKGLDPGLACKQRAYKVEGWISENVMWIISECPE